MLRCCFNPATTEPLVHSSSGSHLVWQGCGVQPARCTGQACGAVPCWVSTPVLFPWTTLVRAPASVATRVAVCWQHAWWLSRQSVILEPSVRLLLQLGMGNVVLAPPTADTGQGCGRCATRAACINSAAWPAPLAAPAAQSGATSSDVH